MGKYIEESEGKLREKTGKKVGILCFIDGGGVNDQTKFFSICTSPPPVVNSSGRVICITPVFEKEGVMLRRFSPW